MKARRLPQEKIVLEVVENLQEIIWAKIASGVKGFIKTFIENLLREELSHKLGASRYERTSSRRGYRNGHYMRDLLTRFGPIERIEVPRMDRGGMGFSVFDRYERRRRDVDCAIGRLFLNGVSTRKLKGIVKEIYGQEVSAQTVSSTLASLDKELERFKDKPIDDTVEFLFLDGISQKVREIGIEKKVMLCAFAIYHKRPQEDNRHREILSFQLTEVEDEASWRGFLSDLKGRGLHGKSLKLIITDGNPALLKAIKSIYPFIKGQRCMAHKMRNVAVKIRKVNRPHCLREAKLIFQADSRKEAIRRFKSWETRWFIEEERAVRCMRKDLFSCLHYYDLDKELWKSIRTTNILERSFREMRRRTRPMNNFFTNEASANRIMHGITDMLNNNWKDNAL
ncbi:MAG: IS256 family transposase, partial [Gammaproteobacteria bacterium]|nr:IS256 family transposase [Gammaproteobacteria bacterium]